MEGLIFWLIGWVLYSVGYYLYEVYAEKPTKVNKKLIIYHAFIYGVASWLGILFIFVMCIVGGIFALHEWIEKKLS